MLRAGLIGFPSSGKTTLFQLLTRAEPRRSARGKTDATVGIARVPDERLEQLATLYNRPKHVPATVEFVDLAGTGRSEAKDLLDVIPYRQADALVHVVRLFRDQSVPHPAGSVNPARDIRATEDELILADLEVVERRLERIEREMKKGSSSELRREQELLAESRVTLEDGRPLRTLSMTSDDEKRMRGFQFLSAKPLLLALNLDETEVHRAEAAIEEAGLSPLLSTPGVRSVSVCARIELEMAQLDEADASMFRAELGLRETGVERLIRATYDLLGYISFLTAGDDECRAWSVPRGSTAVQAAGEIHTDMAKGFIRAEVVRFDRLMARRSMAACREHGEMSLEGKDYVVQDGDVISIRFAT